MEANGGSGFTDAAREAMRRYRETHRTLSLSVHVEELAALRRFVAGPVAIADHAAVAEALIAALEEFDNDERLRAEKEAAEIARGGRS